MFDVVLNGDLPIARDLDIFERVGRGVAHDEYIQFEVRGGKILHEDGESELRRGKMNVEFMKVRELTFKCKDTWLSPTPTPRLLALLISQWTSGHYLQ